MDEAAADEAGFGERAPEIAIDEFTIDEGGLESAAPIEVGVLEVAFCKNGGIQLSPA